MAKGGGGKRRGGKAKGKSGLGDGPIAVQFTAEELGIPGNQALEVGYRAPYAVFVHEDLHAKHMNGHAKFLTLPAQQALPLMQAEAQSAIEEGASRREALLEAGDLLLQASQKLVPVSGRRGSNRLLGALRCCRPREPCCVPFEWTSEVP
jgi:hypothetical protein